MNGQYTMQKKRVKIVFSPVDGMSKSRTIELLDVHCLYCRFDFSSTGNDPFLEHIALSPATMLNNGLEIFKRYWAVTNPAILNAAPTQRETEDNERRIIKQYITDCDDVELDEYERGQEIYCVLESENMDNETIDIDLSKFDVSLLYKGKLLQNNIIKDYMISTDGEKIPLQIIPEDYKDEQ